ncbi:MAG: hypothetical protein KGK33_06185 [Hyphomicrobiales bacterium]|nr:hypothetical protein [Hyphomicrobiales bacterium]MDE2284186.1 hypothetical protein [Hyphomicrobiales bacterium]
MWPSREIVPLALFVALVLVAALHGLAAGGHLPLRQDRTPADAGPALLFGSTLVAAAAAILGIVAALRIISWPAAIIGAGAAALAAPLVLQALPGRFVDGRGALAGFAAGAAVLGAMLVWLAVGIRCGGCG